MTDPHPLDDKLLALILRATEPGSPPPELEHVDEETLALFAEGGLTEQERDELLRHLDVCADCRQTAAWLLADESPVTRPSPPAVVRNAQSFRVVLSVAALVLVTVTIFVLRPRKGSDDVAARETYDSAAELLATSDFDQVQSVLAAAKQRNVWSPALSSLESQVIRRIPNAFSLAQAGRLTAFGYDVGGIASRDVPADPQGRLKSVQSVLEDAGSDDIRVLLNRGHVLLSLQKPEAARRDFDSAVKLAPNDALAWLGLGLANFMLEDFTAAERAFRQTIEIDPQTIDAKFNLAMTLEEAGETAPALEVWEALLKEPLSDADRKRFEDAIGLLKENAL